MDATEQTQEVNPTTPVEETPTQEVAPSTEEVATPQTPAEPAETNDSPIKLRVTNVEKFEIQAQNETVLKVDFVLFKLVVAGAPGQVDSEDVLAERSLNFPLATTQDEIKEELKKYLESFRQETEMFAKNIEADKIQAQADEVISDVNGLEL